ncbi:MAG: HAD-IC family P-type ATPase, partial [Acidimicrobiia bacterium]
SLTFLGFLALADPVRPGASAALVRLRQAGIHLVLVTGDHPGTALRIAGELGLADEADPTVVSGNQIDGLAPEELAAAVTGSRVFARVTPSQKALLVSRLQAAGFVVGVTGDGSNDAAAIRRAEVGVALGAASAPAARHAADLILLDEGIEALVRAVAEARSTWMAVRDAVGLLVGGNLGEVAFILGGTLVGGSAPLLPRQLLLVNLLTDVLPALAIAGRPPPGRDVGALLASGPDALFGEALERLIRRRALCTGAGSTLAWLAFRPIASAGRARTVGLVALVGGQLGQTLAIGRGSPAVLVAMGVSAGALATIVSTPGLSHLFGCRPLGPVGWTAGIGGALAATGAALLLGAGDDLRR